MARDYSNFIYDKTGGFIFAYVPKVACTNWKSLLRFMAGKADWLDSKLAHDKAGGGLHYLDLKGGDVELLSDPGIPKYTMVRDPYSRVLSAYLNKVESRLPLKPRTPREDHFDAVVCDIDAFRLKNLAEERFPKIDFEVFLRWLWDGCSRYVKDEHWTSQTVLLRQPGLSFDFVGRFENLDVDARKILNMMRCDEQFPSQKEVNFASMGTQTKLDNYYTCATQQLVNQIFGDDFKNFAYQPYYRSREPRQTDSDRL